MNTLKYTSYSSVFRPFEDNFNSSYQDEELEINLAGIRKEDIDLEVIDSTLTVNAKLKDKKSIGRTFYLDEGVEIDRIKASYQDGILKVLLPQKAKKSKKIEIT
mgnify:CR=1 FL=1